MAFELGDPVRIEMEKWGHRPHWHIPGRWLGTDEHGDWIGIPAGTHMVRPGADVVSTHDQVGLVPAPGADADRGFLATFHAPGAQHRIYVDMTTPSVWDASAVRAVDLDLDVIKLPDGRVIVDDEDEFADHQVELGYPPEVVALAEASRDRAYAAILAGDAPFDGSHEHWLAALADLIART